MKRVVNIKNMLAAVAIFLVMFCAYTTGSVLDVLFDAKLKAAYLLLALLMMVTSAGIRISKVPLSALALVCCLSVILLNKNANIVHGYFLSDFFLILFGLIMLFAVNTPRWHCAFIKLICIFGCIHAVVTVSQAIAPSIYRTLILPLYAGSRYYTQVNYQLSNGFLPGLSFHYSTNGIYLATSLMLAAVLVICRRAPRRRNFILFLLIAAGLLLTGKRGVTVFSIAGFFMVYYIYKSNKPHKRIVNILALLIALLVVLVVMSAVMPEMTGFIARFQEQSRSGDISTGRFALYALAFQRFLTNPLFGTGWDTFKYFHELNFGQMLNVHNVYIQLLSENGIIGAAPFYFLLIWYYVRTVKVLKRLRRRHAGEYPHDELMLSISVAEQTLFLLYCLTGNPLYDPQALFPYACSVAAGEYCIRHPAAKA